MGCDGPHGEGGRHAGEGSDEPRRLKRPGQLSEGGGCAL